MLESITVRDAEEWQQWLASRANKRDSERKSLGANTVRRRTGVARQIFATAIRWKVIRENPFRGMAITSPVFPIATDARVNQRTGLRRFIVRAGLSVWPKLFHNLRSSRETELLSVYPVADVCRWFGHSPAVAARFYAQARSDVAEKASREPTIFAAKEGSQVGSIAGYIEAKTGSKLGDITIRQEWAEMPKNVRKPNKKSPF
jgi:hypothetical protein